MRRGFTDIHHHLIYGVDDGARDLRTSVKMAELAWKTGTRRIIATPHVTPGIDPIPMEKYQSRLEELREACRKAQIELEILLGAEILYTDMTCGYLGDGRVPTLADTEYVLVEFMPGVRYDALRTALRNILRTGYVPVIAHVERYTCLSSSARRASELKRELDGVLYQMNCSTVIGGRGFFNDLHTRRMLDEGLIDMTASDAHNLRERPTRMREAYQKLRDSYDAEYAASLTGLTDSSDFWYAIHASGTAQTR